MDSIGGREVYDVGYGPSSSPCQFGHARPIGDLATNKCGYRGDGFGENPESGAGVGRTDPATGPRTQNAVGQELPFAGTLVSAHGMFRCKTSLAAGHS